MKVKENTADSIFKTDTAPASFETPIPAVTDRDAGN